MKKYLTILLLFLISRASAYKVTTVENLPMYGYCPCNRPYYNKIYQPNLYMVPYNQYYRNYGTIRPSYQPVIKNYSPKPKITKFRRIGFLNRNNGSMTGYSVPINKDDMYKQMGISPYNTNSKQKFNSINCNQDLFSNPQGNEMYYKNGEYNRDLKGASGKTGVTIIYD